MKLQVFFKCLFFLFERGYIVFAIISFVGLLDNDYKKIYNLIETF